MRNSEVWDDTPSAANSALTEGWHDSNGAILHASDGAPVMGVDVPADARVYVDITEV